MATPVDVSPYLKAKTKHHETDYKYENYLKDACFSNGLKKTMGKPLEVAIFGLGRAGSIHVQNVTKSLSTNLKYIVDPSTQLIDNCRRNYPFNNTKDVTTKEVFEDESVDLVIIATSTSMHEELVEQALHWGKAIFCEKPISQNLDKVAEIYELSKKVQVPLVCGFNRRFDSSAQELKRRVSNGEIGRVHMIKTTSRDSPLPSIEFIKASGGIFHDCIVHDIDMTCWILDEYPVSVSAMGHCFISEIKAESDYDTVALTMQFPSGAISITDVSRNATYGYDQRLEVFGPKGMLQMNNDRPSVVSHSSVKGLNENPIYYSFASRFQRAYENELDHVVNVVRGVEESSISGDHVMRVSRIADALEISAQKRTQVTVQY